MSLIGAWVVVPIMLMALCIGAGFLTERLFGIRVPGAMVPALGLAALIVVTGLVTLTDATAELALPCSLLLAVAGVTINPPWRDSRIGRSALPSLLLAVGVFAVFAAPSLLTGQGSIAGYVKLDDSATWLALTDHVMEHGTQIGDLPVSSYQVTLEAWLGGGYPVGSFLPLGISAPIAGVDIAAAYQPVIALYAAILALGLAACVGGFIGGPWRTALAAFIGIQASLFLGYAQWGGIKEVATAALLPPLGWLGAEAWRRPSEWRPLLLLCIPTGAVLGVLGVPGLTWLAPALGIAATGSLASHLFVRRFARRSAEVASTNDKKSRSRDGMNARRVVAVAGATLAVLAIAGLPAFVHADFGRHIGGVLSDPNELGNLKAPVPLLQGSGLWPVGSFSDPPSQPILVRGLAATCLSLAAAAVVVAATRRRMALPVLFGVAVAGAIPALVIGSPWVDAKVLAIVSPFVLLAAGSLALQWIGAIDRVTALIGAALTMVLAGGTAWSTIAVINEVYVAPRERFAELRFLGERLEGQGPLLVLDFEAYAERHFLRRADPESATGLRYRPVARRDGSLFPNLSTAEVDEVATNDLFVYRTIVRRRSPSASRPPSAYRLIYLGRFWEAWQRAPHSVTPLARVALGAGVDPTGELPCEVVHGLAAMPGARVLSAVPRTPPVVVALELEDAPPSWRGLERVTPVDAGSMSFQITVFESTSYNVWVGGSVLGRLEVEVDGHSVGSVLHELAHGGQWLWFGSIELEQGDHEIVLSYTRPTPAGSGGPAPPLGPFALSSIDSEGNIAPLEVPSARASELCDGRRYDWIEALP